ncbi:uncharacterized protein Arl6 isoform X1 [Tribolium castaneum]|uniref:uncharacterized protein Arl6 isoform X1 n=1 Tax=Tribolium castaneum TaxID=7070 RepID=UPI00077DA36F|nr:PREDICTED: uncharacterized protein LOC107398311 [Tribolium castaneum]XP_015837497.1 PREDICTED: uncharacterized protein LOC107398311 [Tribolium castaneum]|eukprot:XP_015837496.1 PREDICTED: uncharacterized protein LOC107398311 [Tribolium castaneum]
MFLIPQDPKGVRPKTCWTKRSAFQTGLILILFVAVPFFIVMVALYGHSLTAWKQTEKCFRLCTLLRNWKMKRQLTDPTDYPSFLEEIASKDIEDMERRKRDAATLNQRGNDNEMLSMKLEQKRKETEEKYEEEGLSIQHYFPVAALLEKMYFDGNEDRFKCTIAKLSTNWALTTTDCFNYNSDNWDLLSVRSNSHYWSKGGLIKKIENVFWYEKLVAIKLKSDQASTRFYISQFVNVSNREQIFYWDVNLHLPLQKRVKFGELQITNMPLEKALHVPIFDYGKHLIGFQSFKFTYKNVTAYRSWLRELGAFP